MFSAVALTALSPFIAQSQIAHAKPYGDRRATSLFDGYGLVPNLQNPNKGKGGIAPEIGIRQGKPWAPKSSTIVDGTANAKYVHDHVQTGYLRLNKSGISGEPFGPTKSKFKLSREGNSGKLVDWVVYSHATDAEKGKVGMLYKDALIYTPNTTNKNVKSRTPVHLDARLIWNGSYQPDGAGKNNSIHFNTKDISVKEPYKGAANFTLKLYYHTTGKPFKKVRVQIMQTDLDYHQGLIFDTPAYLLYDYNATLNAGIKQDIKGVRWDTTVPGKSLVFGDDGKTLPHHQGTTYASKKESQVSYVPKAAQNEFNVTFVHGYATTPYAYQTRADFATPAASLPASYKLKDLKRDPNHFDQGKHYTSGGQSDYFGFMFNEGTNEAYHIQIDKQVSTKANHFTHTGAVAKPLEVKNTQPIYFDIHTQLKEPSSALIPANNTEGDYNALPIKLLFAKK